MLATSVSHGSVIYREIFPSGSSSNALEQFEEEGWFGGNTGDPFGSNLVGGEGAIGGGAPFAPEMAPVNSNPVGAFPPTSYGFFSSQNAADAWMYTTEYTFDSSILMSVHWDSRNNKNSTNTTVPDASGPPSRDQGSIEAEAMRLAFQILDLWYVSEQFFLHQGDNQTWSTNNADIASLTFTRFDNGSGGSILPGIGDATATGLTLPAGTVTAFGINVDRLGGTVRIDNFTLKGEVPVPAPLALIGLGLAGLALQLRNRARSA
jgi:hypothetical protein